MRSLFLFVLTIFAGTVLAQIRSERAYGFVQLPSSARVSGLGGVVIGVADGDIGLVWHNPAVADSTMHRKFSFSHRFFQAGIQHGHLIYGQEARRWGLHWHAGVQYLNYGNFTTADEFGNTLGSFKVREQALMVGIAKPLYDRLTVGLQLKGLFSQLEAYNASAIGVDIGAYWKDSSGRTTVALVASNLGVPLSHYTDGARQILPFEIRLGFTRRLKYLPFRLGVIGQHLQQWNIAYEDPTRDEADLFSTESTNERSAFAVFTDNFFRHLIFNGEFLLGKTEQFRLRLGYNHLRRKEMTVSYAPRSLAGFSFGFGFRIKKLRLDYGREISHLAGGSHHLGIGLNLNDFLRK